MGYWSSFQARLSKEGYSRDDITQLTQEMHKAGEHPSQPSQVTTTTASIGSGAVSRALTASQPRTSGLGQAFTGGFFVERTQAPVLIGGATTSYALTGAGQRVLIRQEQAGANILVRPSNIPSMPTYRTLQEGRQPAPPQSRQAQEIKGKIQAQRQSLQQSQQIIAEREYTQQQIEAAQAEAIRQRNIFGTAFGEIKPPTQYTELTEKQKKEYGLDVEAKYKREHPIKSRYEGAEEWIAGKTTKKIIPEKVVTELETFGKTPFKTEKLKEALTNIQQYQKDTGKRSFGLDVGMGIIKPIAEYPTQAETYKGLSAGYLAGMYREVREKPLKTAGTIASFTILEPAIAGIQLGWTKILPSLPKVARYGGKLAGGGLKYGLPTLYAGAKGYEYSKAESPFEAGEVLGQTTVEMGAMTAGAKLGQPLARRTRLKTAMEKEIQLLPEKRQIEFRELWKQTKPLKGVKPARELPLQSVQTYQGQKLPLSAQRVLSRVAIRKDVITGGSLSQKSYYKSLKKVEPSHDVDWYFGKEKPLIFRKRTPKGLAEEIGIEFRKEGFTGFERRGAKFRFKGDKGKFLEIHAEQFAPDIFTRRSFPYYEKPKRTTLGEPVTSLREQARRKLAGGFLAGREKDIPSGKELFGEARKIMATKEKQGLFFEEFKLKFGKKGGLMFGRGEAGQIRIETGRIRPKRIREYKKPSRIKEYYKGYKTPKLEVYPVVAPIKEYKKPLYKKQPLRPTPYKPYQIGKPHKYRRPLIQTDYNIAGITRYPRQADYTTPKITGYTGYKGKYEGKYKPSPYKETPYPKSRYPLPYFGKPTQYRPARPDIPFRPPPPTTTKKPEFKLKLGLFEGKDKRKLVKWKPSYFASVEARLKGVIGAKPSKRMIAMGLALRPIVVRGKARKKKRKKRSRDISGMHLIGL